MNDVSEIKFLTLVYFFILSVFFLFLPRVTFLAPGRTRFENTCVILCRGMIVT